MTKFDLTLNVFESKNELAFNLEYSLDLFKKSTMERFIKHFINILENITNNSDVVISGIDICLKKKKTYSYMNLTIQ